MSLKNLGNQFTLKEYVLNQRKMTMGKWVETIEKDGLSHYEHNIVAIADMLGMIKLSKDDLSTLLYKAVRNKSR